METELEIPTLVAPSSNRRRGRPKNEDAEIRKFSIRLTPCDNAEINFEKWFTGEDFIRCIAGREIGEQNKKLHYHIYCETRRSDTWLNNLMYRASNWTPHHERGNAVFSRTIAHEGTLGYSVKEEDIAYSLGFASSELDALLEGSRQYRRHLEADKKRRVRKSQNSMKQIIEDAIEHFREQQLSDPRVVVKFILDKCEELDFSFPSKSQMENIVMKILYKLGWNNYVMDFYCKHL